MTDQSAGDHPRRAAITAVSGASEASITKDVAMISAEGSCQPISEKPEVKPSIIAINCIVWPVRAVSI